MSFKMRSIQFEMFDLKSIDGGALRVIARSKATKQSNSFPGGFWIASGSLSSGAHTRDPLASNDGFYPEFVDHA
jgi:hypothetical protein